MKKTTGNKKAVAPGKKTTPVSATKKSAAKPAAKSQKKIKPSEIDDELDEFIDDELGLDNFELGFDDDDDDF